MGKTMAANLGRASIVSPPEKSGKIRKIIE
jgi:hypothetical protein